MPNKTKMDSGLKAVTKLVEIFEFNFNFNFIYYLGKKKYKMATSHE